MIQGEVYPTEGNSRLRIEARTLLRWLAMNNVDRRGAVEK